LNIDTAELDLTPVLHPHERLAIVSDEHDLQEEGGILLIHINPPELPVALIAIGRQALCRKRIVGYWAWELPDIPNSWLPALRLVDEIWVPSNFVADAIRRHTALPVYVVPHPVSRMPASARDRADFAIPSDTFACLCAFDVRSGYARKNPVAAIKAFRLAFEANNSSNATLMLKIAEADRGPDVMREIREEIGSIGNIIIMDKKLSTEDMTALIQCSDVVISLHRSEGFGLLPAEAMLLGKPVIATRWSGNVDFMNDNNSVLIDCELVPVVDPQKIYPLEGQQWAEPDIQKAAQWLRKLKDDSILRKRIGRAAARDASYFFSLTRYRDAIAATCLSDYVTRA
jgi:glycosyltransferase involved in cell wall biosynthesis